MLQKQNYANHVRYYIPHHFVFYPVVAILLGVCIYKSFTSDTNREVWAMFAILVLLTGWLSYMMRQHYALMNQNRIVRLEMRFRYYRLTQQDFEPIERNLSFGQIAALRFAPDEELQALLKRTLEENLSSNEIKKSITNWQPDHMRV